MVPVVLGIGLVIDYTQAASTKVKLQSASDGAALVVVRDAPNKTDAQLKDAFYPEIQNAVLGRKTPKASLTDAERAVNRVLNRNI